MNSKLDSRRTKLGSPQISPAGDSFWDSMQRHMCTLESVYTHTRYQATSLETEPRSTNK